AAAHAFGFNEAVSLLFDCDTQDEVDRFWTALSADPSAEACGWLKDLPCHRFHGAHVDFKKEAAFSPWPIPCSPRWSVPATGARPMAGPQRCVWPTASSRCGTRIARCFG
ncbi:MAG: hypothetical protein EBX39_10005, partial [Actinobacteria bacterium]|nr:hypothetical protein [Actinomycetota bacterium]